MGKELPGWPKLNVGKMSYTQPVFADIDNDGDLDIFGGGHGYKILERHHNGDTVAGWPVDLYYLECSPIIFDLDNDGKREIVFGDNAGSFHAYNGDGSVVVDWPIPAGGNVTLNSAAVGDVDGDGNIEIALVVSSGILNLWTIEDIPYRSYLTEWGTFYHDNWNTGWMHPLRPKNLISKVVDNSVYLSWNANKEPDIAGYNIYKSDMSGGPYTKINSTLIADTSYTDTSGITNSFYCVSAVIKACTESRLSNEMFVQSVIEPHISNYQHKQLSYTYVHPNPFYLNTTISFSVPVKFQGNMELNIYNLGGQKVKTLINEILLAGKYSIVWDKTDDSGKKVYPGIYIVYFSAGNFVKFEKVTLIK